MNAADTKPFSTVPTHLLPDLLAAERALGRLDQAEADTAVARRHRGDAARRSAAALVRLMGERLDTHDFQTALAAPDHAEGPALLAALLSTLFIQLQNGLMPGGTAALAPHHDDDLTLDPRLSDGRRILMENAIAQSAADYATDDETPAWSDNDTHTTPPVWGEEWLNELHRRWSLVHLGRAEALGGERMDDAAPMQDDLRTALRDAPGLLGAARALRALASRPDRSTGNSRGPSSFTGYADPDWWTVLSWLTAPEILRAACGLRHAWAPLAVIMGRDATGYRFALAGNDQDWLRWFLTAVQDMADHELERLRALTVIYERWQDKLMALNLRTSSRLPDVAEWLFEQPAFTVKRAQPVWKARFELSERGCHLLTGQLAKIGIVSERAGPGGERVWASDLSFLPAGR